MKIVLMGAVFITSILLTNRSAFAAQFTISCRADLVGPGGTINLPEIFSKHFKNEPSSYANSRCELSLGGSGYILLSQMEINQPSMSDSLAPTLLIELFKGNPIQGKLNRIRVQGLDLESWVVRREQRFFGEEFIQAVINRTKYSRLDYVCTLTRVL